MLAAQARAAPRAPYNFVVIMADDLGAHELGSYGHPVHETPNLDRLAAEGMRFRTAFATPICSPSRVLIMSGRYGFRTGWFALMGSPYSPRPDSAAWDIGRGEITFADVLKGRGYKTGLAGKWQLPGSAESRVTDCGFDEYLIWKWKHDVPGAVHTGIWENRADLKAARYWHPGIIENGTYRPTTEADYGPDIYTDFAVDFIRRHSTEPFVLYYPMALPHPPWLETPDPAGGGRRAAGLRSNVEYLDHLVGRIVATLDELELAERTVVFFTADNGTALGGKGQPTELGARVPMIVRAPGTVPAGRVSGALIDLSDVLPTLADLAGAPLPSDRTIDGVSFAPVLRGTSEGERSWIFSYLGDKRVLRDRRWLLEKNRPDSFGNLFDCGDHREGVEGCRRVRLARDEEAREAKRRLEGILDGLPGPQTFPGLIQRSESEADPALTGAATEPR